jgi:hypothetical protein
LATLPAAKAITAPIANTITAKRRERFSIGVEANRAIDAKRRDRSWIRAEMDDMTH